MRAIRSQIRRSWRAGPVRHGGPAAVGFIPKLKIAVGRYGEQHAWEYPRCHLFSPRSPPSRASRCLLTGIAELIEIFDRVEAGSPAGNGSVHVEIGFGVVVGRDTAYR
jgi:hypothetical protein